MKFEHLLNDIFNNRDDKTVVLTVIQDDAAGITFTVKDINGVEHVYDIINYHGMNVIEEVT